MTLLEQGQEIVVDPRDEWQGMPEYKHEDKTAFRKIIVHFKDQDAVDQFAKLVGLSITKKTKYFWHPSAEIAHVAGMAYISSDCA
jgi:hypothetical protein